MLRLGVSCLLCQQPSRRHAILLCSPRLSLLGRVFLCLSSNLPGGLRDGFTEKGEGKSYVGYLTRYCHLTCIFSILKNPGNRVGGGSALPIFHRRVWRSQEVNISCLVSHAGLWNPDLQASAHSLSFYRGQVPWPQSGDEPHPRS